jgi:hypothetical protein
LALAAAVAAAAMTITVQEVVERVVINILKITMFQKEHSLQILAQEAPAPPHLLLVYQGDQQVF